MDEVDRILLVVTDNGLRYSTVQPISRSRVFQWVADFRALEPEEPTDDR